ncbi:uncharacterized protein LOC113146702 [Cyclospora cayetanensis]|uniref:Uncharacterized protein LOC113146702 n=1 Tax=Cyclospora cayetanensis TaxID=88456 RepID=A0A6P6RU62_9EIME|nr:uncharacterized protein LOC113146702 [Cyclospora cayetanensis]
MSAQSKTTNTYVLGNGLRAKEKRGLATVRAAGNQHRTAYHRSIAISNFHAKSVNQKERYCCAGRITEGSLEAAHVLFRAARSLRVRAAYRPRKAKYPVSPSSKAFLPAGFTHQILGAFSQVARPLFAFLGCVGVTDTPLSRIMLARICKGLPRTFLAQAQKTNGVRCFSSVKFLEQKRSGEETVYFKKEDEALLRALLAKHPEADPKFQHSAGHASLESLQSALALCVNKHLKAQPPKAFLDEVTLVFINNGWTPPTEQRTAIQPNQPQ